jgi:heme A synthase
MTNFLSRLGNAMLIGFFISVIVWIIIGGITVIPNMPLFIGVSVSFFGTCTIACCFICACYVAGAFKD